jgi:DNA topoisomerase VI subunit B
MTQKYIVRSPEAGVFYGEMAKEIDSSRIVTLTNARQIWYWEGAATLMQLAKTGTTKPYKCKFTVTVDEIIICNVSEIIPCTEEAMESIESVEEWKEE